jgi:hypothetical protein
LPLLFDILSFLVFFFFFHVCVILITNDKPWSNSLGHSQPVRVRVRVSIFPVYVHIALA